MVGRGFSLMEVLLGLLLLAVAIVPIYSTFSQGSAGVLRTRDEILAHSYAAELIEVAQSLGYDGLERMPGFRLDQPIPLDSLDLGGVTATVEPRFHRTLTVTAWSPTGSLARWPIAYRFLTAEVTWADGRRHFKLTGLVHTGYTTP